MLFIGIDPSSVGFIVGGDGDGDVTDDDGSDDGNGDCNDDVGTLVVS